MKLPLAALFTALLLTGSAAALHAQSAGRISYEGTRRIDPSQLRIVMNGQEVRPGSPDFPSDIPDVRSFAQTLSFAGDFAKEAQEGGGASMIRTTIDGPGGPGGPVGGGRGAQTVNLGRPFEETVYLNLKERTAATVLTVKKDGQAAAYRADQPIAAATGWQLSDQTRKIAGYTCRKASVPFRKETYAVWVTTELPFTYSPIRELTPAQGVVLAVEGSGEQFRATKVDLKAPVAAADVRPAASAQPVTPEELKDLREKARADFRQRMMDEFGGPRGRN